MLGSKITKMFGRSKTPQAKKKQPPPVPNKLVYSMAEVAQLLGLGRTTVYALEKRGLIKAKFLPTHGKLMVEAAWIKNYINEQFSEVNGE